MQQNRELRRRIKKSNMQLRHSTELKADLHIEDLSQHFIATNNDIIDQDIDSVDDLLTGSKQPFSMAELRNILLERNSLKTRVTELEEEISQLKLLLNNSSNRRHSANNPPVIDDETDDLPVQGPINREPEDKLFPKKQQNRILRLYEILAKKFT